MKKVAVRFLSRLGNTQKIAEAIALGADVDAVSITESPVLDEYVDVLFLGGAPYANIMDPELRKYAEELPPENVGKVVLFTTSNWSRRTVLALKKILSSKGIEVENEYFYAHMLNIGKRCAAAVEFGEKFAYDTVTEDDGAADMKNLIKTAVIVAAILILGVVGVLLFIHRRAIKAKISEEPVPELPAGHACCCRKCCRK